MVSNLGYYNFGSCHHPSTHLCWTQTFFFPLEYSHEGDIYCVRVCTVFCCVRYLQIVFQSGFYNPALTRCVWGGDRMRCCLESWAFLFSLLSRDFRVAKGFHNIKTTWCQPLSSVGSVTHCWGRVDWSEQHPGLFSSMVGKGWSGCSQRCVPSDRKDQRCRDHGGWLL